MRKDFYTEQQLMTMPLSALRGLDIENKGQEELVQKVVNRRLAAMPPSAPISRRDVPDIQDQEQEKEWQAKIDARMAKLKAPLMEDAPSGPAEAEPVSEPAPAEPATAEPTQPVMKIRESAMAQPTGEGKPVVLRTPRMGTVRSTKVK